MDNQELEQLKEEYLKTNTIKYISYYGVSFDTPRPKPKVLKPQGILSVYSYGTAEHVL